MSHFHQQLIRTVPMYSAKSTKNVIAIPKLIASSIATSSTISEEVHAAACRYVLFLGNMS